MSTAILIPAERPQNFARIVANIAEATPEPHSVYWKVGTDAAEEELKRLGQHYWRDDGDSWGRRLNFMVEQTTEPYVFFGSDDSLWHAGWLTAAMRAMGRVDGVVTVNDLYNPSGTLFLVSRRYIVAEGTIDQPGVAVHPAYLHQFCDNEIRDTARFRDRHEYCAESVVEHLHPGAGKAPTDEVYAKGEAAGQHDSKIFFSRMHLWSGT